MNLSQSKQTAMNQVLGAVAMLDEKHGTTTQDIFYFLNSLHGKRVQRPAVQSAVRVAMKKGFLTCLNNRYKIKRKRSGMESKQASLIKGMINKRLKRSKVIGSRKLHSFSRSRTGRNKISRVNYLQNKQNLVKKRDCSTSEAKSEPSRKESERKNGKGYLQDLKTRLPNQSNKQSVLRQNVSTNSVKGDKFIKVDGKSKKHVDKHRGKSKSPAAETSTRFTKVPSQQSLERQNLPDPANHSRYNLRPRKTFKSQGQPNSSTKNSVKREKETKTTDTPNKNNKRANEKDADSSDNDHTMYT